MYSHLGVLYLGELTFCLFVKYTFLSVVIVPVLKCTLSNVNVAIPAFLWLVFVWYTFLPLYPWEIGPELPKDPEIGGC